MASWSWPTTAGHLSGAVLDSLEFRLRNCNRASHTEPNRTERHRKVGTGVAEGKRKDIWSHGVTETEALIEILGPTATTEEDREATWIKAIHQLEALMERAPLLLRIGYHALYNEYHPQNSDVWARVGAAVGKTKNQAWRKAHPPGLETDPS